MIYHPNNRKKEVGMPKPVLSLTEAVAIIVGIVVGAGIFKTPSLVAANVGSEWAFLLVWSLGGLISLVGAFCYAELATTYPHAGGEYHYLSRAFGKEIAFLFAWARLSVTQTGSIVLLAFIVGDYISQLLPLGDYSASTYAALAILLLTGLNCFGIQPGKWVQSLLTVSSLLGLVLVAFVGLTFTPTSSTLVLVSQPSESSWGLAMIFVLLTYGGWSEAAYLSAELRDSKRNMSKSLVVSISLITVLYLIVNLAYLRGIGLARIAQSDVVAADLMRHALGEVGGKFISLLIAISALGAVNGTIITGARTNYALGEDVKLFGFLGKWHQDTNTPMNGLLIQGVIALGLVLLGTVTRRGFTTMVEYTAPVFWCFLLLVGLSLVILRFKEPEIDRPFRVPFYPFTPLLFCGTCVYLIQASLMDTGIGALAGAAVLLTGVPILLATHYWLK